MATEQEEGTIVTEEIVDKVVAEAESGCREWEFTDARYTTRVPDTKDTNESNWEYSKAFNKALMAGLPTQTQMEKMLAERGIWGEAETARVDELREKIGNIEAILGKKKPTDKSKSVRKLVTELAEARADLIALNGTFNEYMSQTVESKADEAKQAYLISACTFKNDERVWKDMDSFLTDRDRELVATATYQYMTFSVGLASDYLEDLPEIKFLRAGLNDDGTQPEEE